MSLDETKLLFKSAEVARLLNISSPTLKKLCQDGKIDCIVINTHRYFTKAAIDKFIRENSGNK